MRSVDPEKAMTRSVARGKGGRKKAEGILTGIEVSGFKSLYKPTSIEFYPLTILAGANSSGKSSVMQPLLLLKQTQEATYDPGPLLLDGPHVRFTSSDQLLSKSGRGHLTESFSVSLRVDGESELTNTFTRRPKRGIELSEVKFTDKGKSMSLRPEMKHEEILAILPAELKQFANATERRTKVAPKWRIGRARCFLGLEPRFGTLNPHLFLSPVQTLCQSAIRAVIHVPGLRGNPARTYKTTRVGSTFPGTFDNYVASVVAQWQATSRTKLARLERALEQLGLTWKVRTQRVDDTQVELLVGRVPRKRRGNTSDLVNIADVGFGVSQTLPVVVGLLAANPGQLVYIEQPEIHLHPRAQVQMASILIDAAKRGVRVVVETHSSLILLGIQALVAERKLPASAVKLYWFKRNEDGSTLVTEAILDKQGAFGEWPEDFGEVTLEAESRYLDAAEARQAKP